MVTMVASVVALVVVAMAMVLAIIVVVIVAMAIGVKQNTFFFSKMLKLLLSFYFSQKPYHTITIEFFCLNLYILFSKLESQNHFDTK